MTSWNLINVYDRTFISSTIYRNKDNFPDGGNFSPSSAPIRISYPFSASITVTENINIPYI